jgi:predicted nucleic acid-binding Zn ribbon protein
LQHIGKALQGFIKNSGLEKVLDQQNLIEAWDDVVGEKISKNAKAKSIEYGVLKVKTISPTWRQELFLQKNEIIIKLNEKIKKKIIKDIKFI